LLILLDGSVARFIACGSTRVSRFTCSRGYFHKMRILLILVRFVQHLYRAMHVVLARYCCRQSSVRLSICDVDVSWAYSWTSSKLITWRVFASRSHNIGNVVQWEDPQIQWNRGGIAVLNRKPAIYLKRGKVTIDDQQEVAYTLSIGDKINDTGWPWRAIMHSVSRHMRFRSAPRKFEWR